MGVAVVEEFTDGVPVGSCALAESSFFGRSETGEKDLANVGHGGCFVGRNGLGCHRSLETAYDLKNFRLVERIGGEV